MEVIDTTNNIIQALETNNSCFQNKEISSKKADKYNGFDFGIDFFAGTVSGMGLVVSTFPLE